MFSVFDLDKLYNLLKDFYRIAQIRITVFNSDLHELVSYPESIAPICQLIRSTSAGIDACANCDRDACAEASKRGETYIYRCHAGLTEAIAPLYVNEVLVGYLFFGHVFSYDNYEEGITAILDACSSLPLDTATLESVCRALPLISYEYVRSATQILRSVASYLILERMATLQEGKLAVQLDAYLSQNFTKDLSAQDLCAEFRIGKTQLYRLSKELYGHGIAQHIRTLRIEQAKSMLIDRNGMSIAEIAFKCGYTDYNYFINMFSREVGCSPGVFRKRADNQNYQG